MTATVAQLADRPHRDVGYVLFIEGCPFAFTDRVELVGSGVNSWIGTGNGARRVVLGLTPPESLTYYTNPEHGMLTDDDDARFEIADFDGEMITWFEDVEYVKACRRLGPLDDPAPATLQGENEDETVDIHGKFVGVESIGSAGQRRQFQLFPGDPLPGYDHASLSAEVSGALAPIGVFDAPPWIVGRKLALYMIFRDAQTDTWPSWDDHYSSGYSLIWWGTCSEMAARHKAWSLRARGPSSWLAKMLNVNQPDAWQPVIDFVYLLDDQLYMGVECYYFDYNYNNPPINMQYGASSAFDEALDKFSITTGTWQEFANELDTRLQTVVSTAGPDITWSTNQAAYIKFMQGSTAVDVRIANSTRAAFVRIILHETVWRIFGFDPLVQPTLDLNSTQRIIFVRLDKPTPFGGVEVSPRTNYWIATFSTVPAGVDEYAGDKMDNEGAPRSHYPYSEPGGAVMLSSEVGQEIDLGSTDSTPYLEGQLNVPPEEYTMSHGFDVDTVGFVAFKGPYRTKADEEPVEMVQVAKVTWTDDGGTPLKDLERRLARIEAWLDPRWFGIDHKPITGVWAAKTGTLLWCPVAFLGYDPTFAERAHYVMLRVLLSTGTASWSGYLGQGATQTAGDNDHPDAPAGNQANDLEIADLGLGIYHGLVDYLSFARAAQALPGGANGPLAKCKIGKVGAFDARELFASVMMPRAWQLGLRGGRYSLWHLTDLADGGDIDVTITQADIVSDEVPYIEDVEFTPITPIDNVAITYGQPLVEGVGRDGLVVRARARDIHARARNSNADKTIENVGMVPTPLWDAQPPAGTPWSGEFQKLWGWEIAEWRARPHLLVKQLPLGYRKGKLCAWPGSTVSFSSTWPATRAGSYGVAGRVGRVIRATRDLRTSLEVRIDVILEPTTRARKFAPSAWVLDDVSTLEERHDEASRTLFCYADYYGTGENGHSDVKFFVEPDWFGVGGDILIYGYQYDGRSWTKTFEFKTESVNTTSHTITYQDGTWSGTFWERQYTMLAPAPYSAQPNGSWAREFFVWHTKANGKMGAGNVQGFKLS